MSDRDGGAAEPGDSSPGGAALEELLEEVADGLASRRATCRSRSATACWPGRLEGEDVGLFIGRHGQTIDAVQHLAQRIVLPGGRRPRCAS